jgi:hypothetical protein
MSINQKKIWRAKRRTLPTTVTLPESNE